MTTVEECTPFMRSGHILTFIQVYSLMCGRTAGDKYNIPTVQSVHKGSLHTCHQIGINDSLNSHIHQMHIGIHSLVIN